MAKAKTPTPPPPADGPIAESINKLSPPEPPPVATIQISKDISLHKLDQATNAIETMIPNILKLEAAAGRAEKKGIATEADFNKGSTFVSAVDRELEQLEALRSSIYKPIWDYGKLIQATFSPYKSRLDTIRTKVRDLMTTWYKTEEKRLADEAAAKRKEEEDKAQKIAEEHQEAGRPEVAQAVLDAALAAPAAKVSVFSSGGSAKVNALGGKTTPRKVWKGAIPTTPEDRKAALQAIIDGQLPAIVIEWKQAELNTVARQCQAIGTFHGIRVTHEVDLSQR
jgi:hypothetical protein